MNLREDNTLQIYYSGISDKATLANSDLTVSCFNLTGRKLQQGCS
ncbi:MAG: hypothetical protein ACLU4P_04330 [Ruminococcus sp.]